MRFIFMSGRTQVCEERTVELGRKVEGVIFQTEVFACLVKPKFRKLRHSI